jgi:phospholipid/cholesterol/gamma-HCH transport system permease protein
LQRILKHLQLFVHVGEYISLVMRTFYISLRLPPRWTLVRDQLYAVGVTSLSVVTLTGLSTGLVLATQSFYQLSDKGLAGITGLLVTTAMLTELGPVLTAFMVIGRVGASITAELGTMKVTEQIDALKTLGVDPIRYLISPRMIAGVIMIPLLTFYSIILGIFGGYLISVYFFKMPPQVYFDPLPIYLGGFDVFIGLFKAFVFSIIIMSISCYKGLHTEQGAQGVGQATTTGVVLSYIWILFVNFFLTLSLSVLREELFWWLK